MQTRTRVPARRVIGLAVTETADEVLIYDTERHHIHHLNATTSAVWRVCDGTRDVAALARLASAHLGQTLDETTARLALTKLDDAHLLAAPLPTELRAARLSRRTFMHRAAIAGAIAVPAIASTTAATAAATASVTCGGQCPTAPATCPTTCPDCISGVCASTCGLPCSAGNNPCPDTGCGYCVSGKCSATGPVDYCGALCTGNGDCHGSSCNKCNTTLGYCVANNPKDSSGSTTNTSLTTNSTQERTLTKQVESSMNEEPAKNAPTPEPTQPPSSIDTEEAPPQDVQQIGNQTPTKQMVTEPATDDSTAADTSSQLPADEESDSTAVEGGTDQTQTDQGTVTDQPAEEAPPPAQPAQEEDPAVAPAPNPPALDSDSGANAAAAAPAEQAAPAENSAPAETSNQVAEPTSTEEAGG